MIQNTELQQFLQGIKQLKNLNKQQMLTDTFLIEQEGELAMFYSPHNEYVNTDAKIIIVGITPGWNQMKTAYRELIHSLNKGDPTETALKKVKITASFSGAMRKNLTAMLDEIGLAAALHIPTTEILFSSHRDYLHTTSVIKYPVFHKGRNYTGHVPAINQSKMLSRYAYEVFPKELAQLKHSLLIVPLGKATENVMRHMQTPQSPHIYLFGFPHPFGANGHRKKQLSENQHELSSGTFILSPKRATTFVIPHVDLLHLFLN